MQKCHPVKIHQEKQHWKDQVYINSKTFANAITLASSNEFYCLQYTQFIRLLEKLLTLPCGPAEEDFVQRFRRSVTVQSKKQLIEPVQYDEQGMAFSTSEGNGIPCSMMRGHRRRQDSGSMAFGQLLSRTHSLLCWLCCRCAGSPSLRLHWRFLFLLN